MENQAIQVIDEVVLIKEVTFTNFITESRTGTMTFVRPNNGEEEIHCEFIDKNRKIAKAITELPTEVSFRIHLKYRFLINDGTMLIDVVDAYLNNDYQIHVVKTYLESASIKTDDRGGFEYGIIHTKYDGNFIVYYDGVYDAMSFFIHMINTTSRQSPVLILYEEVGTRKEVLSFKFTDDGDEKDKELLDTITSTDYRLSTYCESDGTVLPKFDYYMDGKIDGIHFYIGEEGPLMILSFQEKVTRSNYRINITNVTTIDYFMSHAMSFSQMPYRFHLHEDDNQLRNQLHGKRCYAIAIIPPEKYEKDEEEE